MSVILKLSEKEIKLLTEALAIRACSLLNQNYAAKFHKLKKKIHKQHAELPKIMIHSVIMNSESGISVDNYLTEESMIEGLNELRAGLAMMKFYSSKLVWS